MLRRTVKLNTFGAGMRRGIWEAPIQARILPPTRRPFSVTPQQYAEGVISFPPTSSPELDAVLDKIRRLIILPFYLPLEQRHRLFRPRYAEDVERYPITMEIDGKKLELRQSEFRQMPPTHKILHQAVKLMRIKSDWDLLPLLLEGLHKHAHRRFKLHHYNKMIRQAGLKGQLYTIIECARRAKDTGFVLAQSEVIQEILSQIVWRTIQSHWTLSAIQQALTWTDMVLDLVRSEHHSNAHNRVTPLHLNPRFLSFPMTLAAVRAMRHLEGRDDGGIVRRRVQDVLEMWPPHTGIEGLGSTHTFNFTADDRHLHHGSYFLYAASPILYGMETAQKVIPSDLAQDLELRRKALVKEVAEAYKVCKDKSLTDMRGVKMFRALFEPELQAAQSPSSPSA